MIIDKLPQTFIDRQRERLEALRDQFLQQTGQASAEERDLNQRHGSEVQDSGDAGAIEADRDNADAFHAKGVLRLGEIRRALGKIAEGSYSLSDESGA